VYGFSSLYKALKYRWVLAVFVGLVLGSAAATATWLLLPAKYTAFALLQVASAEQSLLPDNRSQLDPDRAFENTQVALIKSRPIILAALRRPKVGDLGIVREKTDPATWLEEELQVSFLDKTEILRISLTGTNPEEVTVLVNAVKDAYLEEAVNARRNEKLARLDELENICRSSEETMRSQKAVLRQLAETLKSSDSQALTFKQKMAIEKYAALEKELSQVQSQLRTAQVTLAVQAASKESGEDMPVPDHLVEQALDAHPLVQEKMKDVHLVESAAAQAARVYKAGHPNLSKFEADLKAAKEELAKARDAERPSIVKRLREQMRDTSEAKRQQTKEQVAIWEQQRDLLDAEVTRLRDEAGKIGINSLELELKRAEIEQVDGVLKRLREERERLRIEVQSTKHRVIPLHPAETPEKAEPARRRTTAFAGFAGLFLGLFGVSFWESRHRRIVTKDEIVNDLGLRVLGALPAMHGRRLWVEGSGMARARAAHLNLLVESIDSIRAILLFDESGPGGRLLMVTSARAREGKTTLASHLALSIARAGKRTLLVDCDFRRPELHNLFQMEAGPGLSEVLGGEMEFAQAVRPGPVAGLSILTVGQRGRPMIQALAQDATGQLFETIRQHYDFIIVDSSPVLPVADALTLGKRMDAVLLSVRAEWSQVPYVYAACEQLAALRIPVIGSVLNGTRRHLGTYEYEYQMEYLADTPAT
jgi:capsular exopolysaccharide synthesis family protein